MMRTLCAFYYMSRYFIRVTLENLTGVRVMLSSINATQIERLAIFFLFFFYFPLYSEGTKT